MFLRLFEIKFYDNNKIVYILLYCNGNVKIMDNLHIKMCSFIRKRTIDYYDYWNNQLFPEINRDREIL